MTNNDFFRSNLGIQPKQRLMSAGSFINPVRTYDANEQMRIMESFRGLSAQSDALIDSLIKKKQEDGQKKADEYMTDAMLDPNHPDHRKAKDMMNGLKPQVANLLGTDYWTQQYINKAQAEQIMKKEEYEMLDTVNKYANLSPDEFRVKLGEIRAKTDNELATYPQGVRDYFVRMPRQELTDRIRDEHYKGIMKEQLNTRDTIFVNKVGSTLDGLFDVVYNTPDLEDENLNLIDYENYEKTLTDKAAKEEIDRVALINDWQGQKDRAGYFMPIDYKADILQYRKLSQSPVVEKVLSNMREYAEAGARPGEIKEKIYEAFTKFVTDDDYLGDDAAVLFNIIMDKANKDSVLQKEAGSWNYTSKTGKDQDIALFDMSDVADKGKQLRQLALQSDKLKQAEYEAEQVKNRQNISKFLNDAELSGRIKRTDIVDKTADQIADMLGLNKVTQGEYIEQWRQMRVASTTTPLNENHYFQYDKWKHDIHNGRVTSENQIWQGLLRGEIHPRHYDALVAELDSGELSAKELQLHNFITKYAKEYLKLVYVNEPAKIITMSQQVDNYAFDGIKDGTFTSIYDANDYGSKILQMIGAVPGNQQLIPNKSTSLYELQTRQQFKDTAKKELVTPAYDDKTKVTGPQLYLFKEDTYENFLNNETIKKYKELGMPETVLKEMYNDLREQSRQKDKEVRKNFITDKLNQGYFDINDLTAMYYEQPDTVNEFLIKELGGEIEIMNGLPVPKEKKQREYFFQLIRQYGDNDKNIMFSLVTALETKPYKRKMYAHSKEPFGRYAKRDNVDTAQTK